MLLQSGKCDRQCVHGLLDGGEGGSTEMALSTAENRCKIVKSWGEPCWLWNWAYSSLWAVENSIGTTDPDSESDVELRRARWRSGALLDGASSMRSSWRLARGTEGEASSAEGTEEVSEGGD